MLRITNDSANKVATRHGGADKEIPQEKGIALPIVPDTEPDRHRLWRNWCPRTGGRALHVIVESNGGAVMR